MSKMTIEYGDKVWRNKAGQFHRSDGPAIIRADGSQAWYINGARHRLAGPAIIRPDGSEVWYLNGLYHRLDGPAIIRPNGSQGWYINGFEITDHATAWIKENNFPDYTLWTDGQKIMFRLAFSGTTS